MAFHALLSSFNHFSLSLIFLLSLTATSLGSLFSAAEDGKDEKEEEEVREERSKAVSVSEQTIRRLSVVRMELST